METPQLLKAREAVQFLGGDWNLQRLYAAAREKRLFPPGVVIYVSGKSIRFHRERLKAWKEAQPKLISAAEVAEFLRCDRNRVYFNADPENGVFPPEVVQRKSGRLLIDQQALERWLAQGGNLEAA